MPWVDLEAEILEEFAGACRGDLDLALERLQPLARTNIDKLRAWIAANPELARISRRNATRKWRARMTPEAKERERIAHNLKRRLKQVR